MSICTMCGCGKPATTEVKMVDGKYEDMCDDCYSQTDEAEIHRCEYMAILRFVRDGNFVLGADGIYRGPHGMSHGQEDHDRMLAALATSDPSDVDGAVHSLDRAYLRYQRRRPK